MLRRRFFHTSALLATSALSLLPHLPARAQEGKLSKKLRDSVLSRPDLGTNAAPAAVDPPRDALARYQWKTSIVTTTFWIGENATKNNPVPNHASSWDENWARNYGGTDEPDRAKRSDFKPASFTPGQNPFYVALPYNDVTKGQHKPEASLVIPWFKESFQTPGRTVCKGRWIAIRFGNRVAYAQWEDCGPFRTDHWQYVFGNERPKPNLNKGAGLDVSPAVRDYLGMNDTDVTDWKFVDFSEVPQGPWSKIGENNTFVQNARTGGNKVAMLETRPTAPPSSSPVGLRPAGEIFQPIR